VLSIHKLSPGGEEYYLSLAAGAADEYYPTEGAGEWLGKGAEAVGLTGPASGDDLRAILAGADPRSGEPLADGIRAARRRRPGFDLTFSAPKGVSLLSALHPDSRVAVEAAHADAVGAALGYLEDHLWARRGVDGLAREPIDGIVAAGFTHRTSRAGDPQLHTHVLVANLVRGTDDRWSAPDARALYRHLTTAGHLYQAHLRAELTDTLGLGWGPIRKGMAEPAGFTTAQLRAFSTRRADIETALDAAGHSTARAAEVATLTTRPAKDRTATSAELLAAWQERAAELGLDADILPGIAHQVDGRQLPDADQLAETLLGPAGLTAHRSAADRRAVLRAVAGEAQAGLRRDELESLTDAILADRRVVTLAHPTPGLPAGDDEHVATTVELIGLEAALIDSADWRQDAGVAVVAHPDGVSVEDTTRLSDEQTTMVAELLGSGRGVEIVVGAAGSGKTTALGVARAGWEAHGTPVVGLALAARAADQLQAGAGIESMTIARFLADATQPDAVAVARGSVVVVDEAAMVGTRDLARIAALVEAADGKLILVGDHRQLPEIGAGGAFGALTRRLPAIELVENRRQVSTWERHALAELRSGDVARAVDAWAERDRLHVCADASSAHTQIIAAWADARRAGTGAVIYAQHRADVDALNRAARRARQSVGDLTGPELVAAGRTFAVGDEVVAMRNNRTLGLRNGTQGIVSAIDPTAGNLTVAVNDPSGAAREVLVSAGYLERGRLDHAYALTFHKAQGASVEQALVLGSDAIYREAAYTAMSRARQRVDLFIPTPLDPGLLEDHRPRLTPPTPAKSIERLRADLSASAAQRLGLDQAQPAGRTRAGEDVPTVVIAALGPRPVDARDQQVWDQAAGSAVAFRERHHIGDPVLLLGPSGGDATRVADREAVRRTVERARLHLGRSTHTQEIDL